MEVHHAPGRKSPRISLALAGSGLTDFVWDYRDSTETSANRTWNASQNFPLFPGIFNRGVTTTLLSAVTDGTSNTILVAERNPERCGWGGAFSTNFGNTYTGQKINSPTRTTSVTSDWWRNCGVSSYHTSGAQVVAADGSVHFLTQTIDHRVYCSLGDKADGNSVAGGF